MKKIIKRMGLLVAMLLTILPASAYDFEVDGFYYEVISFPDLTCKVVEGDNEYEGDIVIPSEVNYNSRTLKVTEIGSYAFYGCDSLTSIVIPDSVTEIGSCAFYDCDSLTSIVIPDSVTEIERCAFSFCDSLASIVIPDSVTYIGIRAFAGCSSLEEIKLSNSLETLNFGTFSGCKSLKSLTIPGSVIELVQYELENYESDFLFDDCDALKEIKFEYGVDEIAGYYYYFQLSNPTAYYQKDITFPKGNNTVLELEKVFIDRRLGNSLKLPYLKELTLGEHVEEVQIIPSKSEDLETITCFALVPPECPEFTNGQYINTVVKIPDESLDAYQNADRWKNFWNLQGFGAAGIEKATSNVNITEIGRYDLNGNAITDDYTGITIIRYSNGATEKIVVRK